MILWNGHGVQMVYVYCTYWCTHGVRLELVWCGTVERQPRVGALDELVSCRARRGIPWETNPRRES